MDVYLPRWLGFCSTLYQSIPRPLGFKDLKTLKNQDFVFEIDEICPDKKSKIWAWIVPHRPTRRILAYQVGDRGQETCSTLWNKIPPKIRENGMFYTDACAARACVIPQSVHAPQEKRGETRHVERFKGTPRAKSSGLVRSVYSFSPSLDAIIGAVGYAIYSYNRSIKVSTPV